MDPSIMKLLEEDEDETAHSGADVEAFTAALNRDIGGDSSDLGLHENNFPTQTFGEWQPSIHKEASGQNKQEDQQSVHPREQNTSEMESTPNQQQQILSPSESNQTAHQSSIENEEHQLTDTTPCQIIKENEIPTSNQNLVHRHDQNITQQSDNLNQHIKAQQLNNPQAPPTNWSNNQVQSNKPGASTIQLSLVLPHLLPSVDKDRAMQLQQVTLSMKKKEIGREDYVRVLRNIVGDQMLRQAVNKVKVQQAQQTHVQTLATRSSQKGPIHYAPQSHASTQQHSSPFHNSQQFPESHSIQKFHSLQANQHSKIPENSSKTREVEHKSDIQGLNVVHTSSMIASQPINTQQNLPQPPTSFPMHTYSGPSNSTSMVPQAIMPAHRGTPQPTNMNTSKYELHSSLTPPIRMHGGSLNIPSHSGLQLNKMTWPPAQNGDIKVNSSQTSGYVKSEMLDQTVHQQKVPSPFTSVHDQQSAHSGLLKNEQSEKLSEAMGFSSMNIMNQSEGNIGTHMDPTLQATFSSSPVLPGSNLRTPPKKSVTGQKKPIDSIGTSSLPSKKQKIAGAFADQSIEQLNDVTAVSGVDLREEEEQLFSGSKDESRASEASRRVVREEEEKLILQKGPLQKKISEIMSECGLKGISNDVERCLSLCVEERLRGLICNLIRLSKHRVDIEKSRHRVVITSDVRQQILLMNRKTKEEWEKKQAEEAEKLRKLNENEGNTRMDAERDKDESHSKFAKANKEEDDKMRTTAANVAARAAVGGDDMLSKWQLMAEQARKKREGGLDGASNVQQSKDELRKTLPHGKNAKSKYTENKSVTASSAHKMIRKIGKNPIVRYPARVSRSISIKDVIAALEREPQMSKSTLLYRLYERMPSDTAIE